MHRFKKKKTSLIVINAIFESAERSESACFESYLTRECNVAPF